MESGFDKKVLELAAKNIAQEIGDPPAKSVLIICTTDKHDIAEAVVDELEKGNLECHLLQLGSKLDSSADRLRSLVSDIAGTWGIGMFLQPAYAPFLFETVGSPFDGLHILSDHLFCDWLIRPASLVRIYGVDMDELRRFRRSLLAELATARRIRVTTEKGTDVTIEPRSWTVSNGEVFTAPVEERSSGTIHIDACAYGGPPAIPFTLRVENGRVINVSELIETDKQQGWVRRDMTRDENANVLAELGIGISLGARWDEDMMESEQARGTCHFGFGHNIFAGGQNTSSYHFDLVILKPTVEVDGKCICTIYYPQVGFVH